MGPKNNALTGEIADGWTPIWLPLIGIPPALAELQKKVDVAPCVIACVMESVEEARNLIRTDLAYYVGGMGTFYRDAMSRFGFAEQAAHLHTLWQSGRRKEAILAATDEMVDAIAAAGPADRCRKRIDDYRRAGVDMPVVVMPRGASPSTIRETLGALI